MRSQHFRDLGPAKLLGQTDGRFTVITLAIGIRSVLEQPRDRFESDHVVSQQDAEMKKSTAVCFTGQVHIDAAAQRKFGKRRTRGVLELAQQNRQ
jgi:hypothetical protein